MQKRSLQLITFLCTVVSLLWLTEPFSTVAGTMDSQHEEDYVFYTEDGVQIEREVLRITDSENYSFEEYVIDSYKTGRIDTYRLYKQGSEKAYSLGYEDILLMNDEVYLITNGVCTVNQFYYLGTGDDGGEYWLYFGSDGKMVKDTVIHDLFSVDKNGLFDYR